MLRVDDLKKFYPIRGGVFSTKQGDVKAVQGVSFDLQAGETLGLVGESGCGKSTLGRTVMRLEEPTGGRVLYRGKDLVNCSKSELFALRGDLQMIFQDPYSSLNPRLPVGEIIREPLDVHKVGTPAEREKKVRDLCQAVGLKEEVINRYPHEFSGGQRQRVGIARALALDPDIIIADEPVSALDVSVQAQVINLMVHLQRQLGLTYLFISHDLSVVEYISDSVAIMYLGRIVEKAKKETIFSRPTHPYTRALLESVPQPDPRRRRTHVPIQGEIPSPVNPPSGCAFHPRCPFAIEACKKDIPPLEPFSGTDDSTHLVACIRKNEI
ncbi:MAG: dipeptide ABC transporter ATP-binding protein [Candidatus Eisenbacteria bacterium]|uniref:Dipeptide ABC transporter ATP-binding protein n=1 Tax=Eiseniibacteriota bacterium TaxID=2212470 RepID=A0A956RRN9_UNCEI|nr:dipeptide ABC transporter ATP-binding protein [Candidatus Eisenbacteria bacterium]